MKVKRMVKRLSAIGAGALMLGATAMGAMAADLSDYPTMFVDDGTFNGLFVVGEAAAAVDNLAMTDIATSMKAPGGSSTSVTVEGDAWKVTSGSDVLEFSEALGPSSNGVVSFLDDDNLAALAGGDLTSSQGTFDYEQFLHFDNAVINTSYEEDDDDSTDLFVKIADGRMFARYELNFLEAAESDIDASESFELDDYEGKSLMMFGKKYDIVKAVTGGANSNKVTLTMMAGSATDTLLEGESATYTIGGKEYEVSLSFTDSSSRAKFVVNGEATPLMDEGDTETLSDGTVLGLSKVLYQDYAGGIHRADFFLGADKLVLEDDDIAEGSATDELQVNDETIDGADVRITGAMLDNATSTTEDGELEIDTIEINMTAQDDLYVAAGETLSGQAELAEVGLLFGGWDLQFEGLDPGVESDMISVTDASGEKQYDLTFTNINGEEISFPIAYATGGSTVRPGDQNDPLRMNLTSIADEDYFILNDGTTVNEDSVTHVVQYKSSDDVGKSNPKIKFKILATGEIVERPVTFGATQATATLKLSGTTYNIQNVTTSGGGGDVSSDDWNITVTNGDAGTYVNGGASGVFATAKLVTKGGGLITLTDSNVSVEADQLMFNISLIDGDRHDDVRAAGDPSATAPYTVFSRNISVSSTELDFATFADGDVSVSLTSPDDDSDNSYGYAVNGAWVHLNSPSGGGTTADEVKISWPENLKEVLLYVTSGSTQTISSSSGDLTSVVVVDATKLDSEVANVEAQNLIAVGGPCVNSVSSELLGSPSDCTEGFTPGVARVKLFEHANGNVAMLVAGYSGQDTRLAGQVLAHRWDELSGDEVEIEGTTSSDATISAPSVAAAPSEE